MSILLPALCFPNIYSLGDNEFSVGLKRKKNRHESLLLRRTKETPVASLNVDYFVIWNPAGILCRHRNPNENVRVRSQT